MQYSGSYPIFDLSKVKTYPLRQRQNKVEVGGFVDLAKLRRSEVRCSREPSFRNGRRGEGPDQSIGLRELAAYVVQCHREEKPVVILSGAHPIKNGQNPIIIDLIERGIITLYGTNGAGAIHSFELALTGAS